MINKNTYDLLFINVCIAYFIQFQICLLILDLQLTSTKYILLFNFSYRGQLPPIH